jgi:single-stranded DNA-binding protein
MTSARVANRNHMTSFYFRTIGCLARNPELVTSEQGAYYRFCLTGHDYTEDEQGQFKVEFQSLWFVASQATGVLIAMGAGKGDQLIVEGRIYKHHWTAKGAHDTTFMVTAFQFGARRHPGSPAASTVTPAPDSPLTSEEEGAAVVTG